MAEHEMQEPQGPFGQNDPPFNPQPEQSYFNDLGFKVTPMAAVGLDPIANELAAMKVAHGSLSALDGPARARALRWLQEVMG